MVGGVTQLFTMLLMLSVVVPSCVSCLGMIDLTHNNHRTQHCVKLCKFMS